MLQETLGRLFAGRRDLARARADGGVGSPDDMLDKARFKVDVKHASAWWRK